VKQLPDFYSSVPNRLMSSAASRIVTGSLP